MNADVECTSHRSLFNIRFLPSSLPMDSCMDWDKELHTSLPSLLSSMYVIDYSFYRSSFLLFSLSCLFRGSFPPRESWANTISVRWQILNFCVKRKGIISPVREIDLFLTFKVTSSSADIVSNHFRSCFVI